MILVLGKVGCSACEMAKKILDQKNILYDYKNIDDLMQEEKEKYISLAQIQQKMSLPIIIKDNKCYSIQDIMKGVII